MLCAALVKLSHALPLDEDGNEMLVRGVYRGVDEATERGDTPLVLPISFLEPTAENQG